MPLFIHNKSLDQVACVSKIVDMLEKIEEVSRVKEAGIFEESDSQELTECYEECFVFSG